MKRTKLKYSMIYLSVRNKNSNSENFLCALLTLSHHHKNYNFLDCDWFKKLILLYHVVIGQFVIGRFVLGQFNKPITFKVAV